MVLDRPSLWIAPALRQLTEHNHDYPDAYIQWPSDQPDRATMGGKGAALAALSQTFPIPPWFVLTPAAFLASLTVEQREALAAGKLATAPALAHAVAAALAHAVTTLDPAPQARFAVRSSAVSEDGATASFAGQLRSFLQVRREEISERVCAVWQSAFAEHVARYRQQTGGTMVESAASAFIPAVIVQRMVDADVAGVAFGADPVTGDRSRCTITAVRGLADQLVSGAVNGDSYLVDRQGIVLAQNLLASMPLLVPKTVVAVTALLQQVEAHVGIPQDIEWALADGELFLLQARPITTLLAARAALPTQSEEGDQQTIWDNSNIVESYSGVTSPLTFSFAQHVYAHVYVEFCRLMGVAQPKIDQEAHAFRHLLGTINGHVYYNLLNWYRILALFPGFQMNRRFMEQMMGVKEPLPAALLATLTPQQPTRWAKVVDGLRLARAGMGLIGSQFTLGRTIKRFYHRLDEALTRATDWQRLSLAELAIEYRTVEQQLLTQWDAPLINDFLCMIAFGLSRKLLERQAGAAGLQLHSALLIGQGDIISAEPAQRIRAMAALAAQDERLVERLLAGTAAEIGPLLVGVPALSEAYNAYLAKFGNRCLQELKLESPTLHDDPTPLLRAIGQMARRPPTPCPPHPAAAASTVVLRHQLAPLFKKQPLQRQLATWAVQWAKARVRDRENLRFERTRVFGYARQIFLAMGQRLWAEHLLEQPRDIFLLTVDEVLALAEGMATVADPRPLIAQRKAERAHCNRLPAPPNRLTSDDVKAAWFTPTGAWTSAPAQQHIQGAAEQRGIGCSAGVVRAPVRVVKDPRTTSLQPGEIMVARFTDPGWITLFANAAGILVERGSLLSHSAIVARELGIPAIVAIDGVMAWLQTGDMVEMDGATGRVCKV